MTALVDKLRLAKDGAWEAHCPVHGLIAVGPDQAIVQAAARHHQMCEYENRQRPPADEGQPIGWECGACGVLTVHEPAPLAIVVDEVAVPVSTSSYADEELYEMTGRHTEIPNVFEYRYRFVL